MSRGISAEDGIYAPAIESSPAPAEQRRRSALAAHARRTAAEKLIAVTRVVVASFALLALWLDPLENADPATGAWVAGYALCSILFLPMIFQARSIGSFTRVILQAGEMLYFSALVYLTRGSGSLFFTLFAFSVICASLRFGSVGTMLSAAAAACAFAAASLYSAMAAGVPLELNRFVIRTTHLLVVGALLVWVARHQRRLSEDLTALGSWPRETASSLNALMLAMLPHAAHILGAERVVIVWDEPDEPWASLAGHPDPPSPERIAVEDLEQSVDPDLASVDFLSHREGQRDAVLYRHGGELRNWMGTAVGGTVRSRLGGGNLLSACLPGRTFDGRLYAATSRRLSVDDLLLAQTTAVLIGARLDEFRHFEQSREAALRADRGMVARDLHDGLLQSLTGIILQLEVLRGGTSISGAVADKLESIQQLLEQDQRDLRRFVQQLRPLREEGQSDPRLEERLSGLGERMRVQWAIDVAFEVGSEVATLPSALLHETYSIVHEAVANTAKHGGASWIRVAITVEKAQVCVQVKNDGHGFPFHGRFSLAELQRMKRGPVSLKERISLLGGDMVLESSSEGSTLTMMFPSEEVR